MNKGKKNQETALATESFAFTANSVFNIFAALCSIVSLLLAVFNDNGYIRAAAIVMVGIVLILLINKKWSYNKLKKDAEAPYQEKFSSALEIIKNYNFDYTDTLAAINNGNIATYEQLDQLLRRISTCIEELSRGILQERVCVCIKMIETKSAMDEDYLKWNIKTIARSQATKRKRTNKDARSVLVSDNSDFLTIIEGNDSIHSDSFIVPNLPGLIEVWRNSGREYKNSTNRFLDDYKSTIVFPIRIEASAASKTIRESSLSSCLANYHIIGFLCLDSMRIFEKEDQSFGEAAELLESFADSLYPLLESYVAVQLLNVICEKRDSGLIYESCGVSLQGILSKEKSMNDDTNSNP